MSNFLPRHLLPLVQDAEIQPMINQIERHLRCGQPETETLCRERGIPLEAWSPPGSGRLLERPDLVKMAGAYGKSAAQLCLRWSLQQGFVPLRRSVRPARIRENTDIFDFEISAQDMRTLDGYPRCAVSGMHPDEVNVEVRTMAPARRAGGF